MSETKNCGLYITDDSTTKFQEWRRRMGGETDSNMVKIDAALAAKQDKLSGIKGQVIGFDEDGKAVVQEAPDANISIRTVTAEEYAALTDEQKQENVFYILPDEETEAVSGIPAGGSAGQILAKASSEDFDTQWVDPASGGVESFNGRSGAVMPQAGDYTASDVGAAPITRKVNGKSLSSDITLNAADVGALSSSGTAATKLATGRTIKVDLTSASTASFDGSANITPGVFGTLSPANGGTGYTTLEGLINAIINRTTKVNSPSSAYSTYMARGIAAGTSDLTAGSSSLTNGCIYLVYE